MDTLFLQSGYPVIAYVRFPNDLEHTYHYARWTGNKWVDKASLLFGFIFWPLQIIHKLLDHIGLMNAKAFKHIRGKKFGRFRQQTDKKTWYIFWNALIFYISVLFCWYLAHFHWYTAQNQPEWSIMSGIAMKLGKISTNKTEM